MSVAPLDWAFLGLLLGSGLLGLWRGLVYDGVHPQVTLSRKGLEAYGQIPLLRTVSLDRTFYAPISTAAYAR